MEVGGRDFLQVGGREKRWGGRNCFSTRGWKRGGGSNFVINYRRKR